METKRAAKPSKRWLPVGPRAERPYPKLSLAQVWICPLERVDQIELQAIEVRFLLTSLGYGFAN